MGCLSSNILISKLLIVFLLELFFLFTPSVSQGDVTRASVESNSILLEGSPGEVSIEIQGENQQDGGVTLVFTRTNGGGWQQRFHKVQDALELRVTSSSGKLIEFANRGLPGKYTWTSKDPGGETQDITQFVGTGNEITLWARVTGTGARRCVMDTLADGLRKCHWEFDDIAYNHISR